MHSTTAVNRIPCVQDVGDRKRGDDHFERGMRRKKRWSRRRKITSEQKKTGNNNRPTQQCIDWCTTRGVTASYLSCCLMKIKTDASCNKLHNNITAIDTSRRPSAWDGGADTRRDSNAPSTTN